MSTLITKNPEFLQNSIKLDSDIYFKLGGILLNKKIDYDLLKEIDIQQNLKNIDQKIFDTTDDFNENNILKEKLKEIIEIFNSVNSERIFLREILIQLINKKFWKIENDIKNENFFINKIKGINFEILKKTIQKKTKEIEKNLETIQKKNKLIGKLKESNESLEISLQKSKENFKNLMLNNKKTIFLEKKPNSKSKTKRNISKNSNFSNVIRKKTNSKRVIKRRKNSKRIGNFKNSEFWQNEKNAGKEIALDLDNIKDLYNLKNGVNRLVKRSSLNF